MILYYILYIRRHIIVCKIVSENVDGSPLDTSLGRSPLDTSLGGSPLVNALGGSPL